MRCPFVREAQVRYCCASAYKKMIVRTSVHSGPERCSSPDWKQCPVARQHQEEHPSQSHCPFLQEALVQYCSSAPVAKYVPYTEVASRCGTENHRYCDFFLSIASPKRRVPSGTRQNPARVNEEYRGGGMKVPPDLYFTPNHMWLNVSEDRNCHIGINELLARVLGKVDDISFLTTKGSNLPAVVMTIRGVDLHLTFPKRISISSSNSYLRGNKEKIISDPYTLGWLFEGAVTGTADTEMIEEGFIRGEQASIWMADESKRMTEYVHQLLGSRRMEEQPVTMADGGTFGSGLVRSLCREEMLKLFNEFFSSSLKWRIP